MPLNRYIANIILTFFINLVLTTMPQEYFSGFRGINLKYLKNINLKNFQMTVIEQQLHFVFIKEIIRFLKYNKNKIRKNQISMIPPRFFGYQKCILFSI